MNKVLPGLRFVASYSGGKDSVLAIHRAQQSGMKLQALLITYNVDRGRSWFHGIPAEVLAEVERSVGVPVRLIRTTGPEYAAAFEAALTEEKALGAIKKGGSRPLVEVVGLGERPERKGFVIMDAPCPAVENLSSLVAGGCHCIVFSTGRGNVSGNPISPVIKLSGNPDTVALLRDNIDVDVSGVITQGLPMAAAADELESFLSDVCYGAKTAADMLAEHEVAVSRFMRML